MPFQHGGYISHGRSCIFGDGAPLSRRSSIFAAALHRRGFFRLHHLNGSASSSTWGDPSRDFPPHGRRLDLSSLHLSRHRSNPTSSATSNYKPLNANRAMEVGAAAACVKLEWFAEFTAEELAQALCAAVNKKDGT